MSRTASLPRGPRVRTGVARDRPDPGPGAQTANPFADRTLTARAIAALGLANLRYWGTVAPLVRTQLTCWERRARAIPGERPRALAAAKLREERFNAEVAATLATLAPRPHRAASVRAIAALQIMYDYLDLLTEQPLADPVADGRRLFATFTGALVAEGRPSERSPDGPRPGERGSADTPMRAAGSPDRDSPGSDDGGYLASLAAAVAPARCAQAQVLSHAAAHSDPAVGLSQSELERWAGREASATELGWQEFLAGSTASVLAVHALIAAAANPASTRREAEALDGAYLWICALTVLDSLVDRAQDRTAGQPGYARHYASDELMAERLVGLARGAAARAAALLDGAHHVVTLVGIVAYYGSARAAGDPQARAALARVRRELRPLIAPTLALMRAWRLAKRTRTGARGLGGGQRLRQPSTTRLLQSRR
jgi:tetraprenyl-beta-curcumene synthase